MNLTEAIEFGRTLTSHPNFVPQPGMKYFLMTDTGRIHGRGTIESIHPEWGPIDNGAPIDDGWVPDFRDDKTFDLCLGCLVRNQSSFQELM